ncbi:hypothetical protein EHM76_01005 [bacterium]|nr:MAG: hypothetical protein EHM76_01005 [bacterium]
MIGPRLVDKPLVLYGYGKLGHLAEEIFRELGIPIVGYWNKDCIPYIKDKDLLVAICVATEQYSDVIAPLKAAGWNDIVPVMDIIEAYPAGIHNGWFAGPLTHEDRDGMTQVAIGLPDKISRSHYYAHLEWRRYRDELAYEVEPREVLPSTLADLRERQYPTAQYLVEEYVHVHCEGYELETLRNCIGELMKYRPKIEVACYHSRDSLWKIEKLLMDSLPDYHWKFRLSAYMGLGAYIYGTPKEKL